MKTITIAVPDTFCICEQLLNAHPERVARAITASFDTTASEHENTFEQLARCCPDSAVIVRQSDNCTWERCFGPGELQMKCDVRISDHAEAEHIDMTSQIQKIDPSASCGLLLFPQLRALPANKTDVQFSHTLVIQPIVNDRFVVAVAGTCYNPDLLSAAVAVTQHAWLSQHVCTTAPSHQQLEHAVINGFANTLVGALEQHRSDTDELVKRLQDVTVLADCMQRKIVAHSAELTTVLDGPLKDVITIEQPLPALTRRRRSAKTILHKDMSARQREIVQACVAFMEKGNHLRSTCVNNHQVAGVSKYEVDTLFGNFTTLRRCAETALHGCQTEPRT